MELQSHEISCPCGHTYETDRTVNWCPKCGEKIFDSDKDRQAHKLNNVYMYAVIGLAVSALAFFVYKLILIPVLTM